MHVRVRVRQTRADPPIEERASFGVRSGDDEQNIVLLESILSMPRSALSARFTVVLSILAWRVGRVFNSTSPAPYTRQHQTHGLRPASSPRYPQTPAMTPELGQSKASALEGRLPDF